MIMWRKFNLNLIYDFIFNWHCRRAADVAPLMEHMPRERSDSDCAEKMKIPWTCLSKNFYNTE